MFSTYGDLKNEVVEWANRADITDRIGSFVRLFEAKANQEIRHWRQQVRAQLSVSTQFVDLPDSSDPSGPFREAINLQVAEGGRHYPVETVSAERLDEIKQRHPTAGRPQFVAIVAGELEFVPVPDQAYTVEMLYYRDIPTITGSDSGTNWLLTYYPHLYLFGTLCELEPYVQEDNRFPLWKTRLDQEFQQMRVESRRAEFAGPQHVMPRRRLG